MHQWLARRLLKDSFAMTERTSTQRNPDRRRLGVTVVEIVVVVGMIGVLAALGGPVLDQWFLNSRTKSAARSVADAFMLARGEAIRTGNAHLVFLSASPAGLPPATDPAGTGLGVDLATGGTFPVLIVDDGPIAGVNCVIDAADPQRSVHGEIGVNWGFSQSGGLPAPNDNAGGFVASGSSFTTQGGGAVTWVMFRPDGIPVTFDNACNQGPIGTGNGAVYIPNGTRDYAVVLSALGGVRVHVWDPVRAAWSN